MDIIIIGSGNTATVLGRLFRQGGHRIKQIAGRNPVTVARLANELDAGYVTDFSQVALTGDLYLIAVRDEAIETVAGELTLSSGLVAHTSGSASASLLAALTKTYGVLYPLQSLRHEITYLPEIPFLIEGSDEATASRLESFAKSVTPAPVRRCTGKERLKLHVAAVAVNNFANHLYALTREYCEKESLVFEDLIPLIRETSARIEKVSPRQVQTGPAIRKDRETIRQHLDLLQSHPALKEVYQCMTESIKKWY